MTADLRRRPHGRAIRCPAEAPVIAFFAIKWLSRDSAPALRVLALQIAAALAPLALVFVLEL